jgi:O-antigen/teichoic acid export membrane protein
MRSEVFPRRTEFRFFVEPQHTAFWEQKTSPGQTEVRTGSQQFARMRDHVREWIGRHPARAASLAGWYQQGASGIVTVCLIPFAIQKLGSEQAGLWFSFQGILALLNLCDFGFGFAVSRQASFTLGSDGSQHPAFVRITPGQAGMAALARCADRAFMLLGAVACLIVVFLHEAIFPFTKICDSPASWSWYALGGASVLQLLSKGPAALLEGAGHAFSVRLLAGTYQFLSGLAAVLILFRAPNLGAMSTGFLLTAFCHYCAVRWWARKIAPAADLDPAECSRITRGLWSAAVPIGVVSLSGFCVTAIQVPLIAFFFGPSRVLPFYAAQKIGGMLMAACSQILSPHLPFFTMEWARNARHLAMARMSKNLRLFTIATVASQGIFFLSAPFVGRYWLGPHPFVDTLTLGILALDYTLLSVTGGISQFVLAAGRNPFIASTVLMGVLNLVGCSLLGTRFEFAGIAACSLISGLLTQYWWIAVYARRFFRSSPVTAA